MCNLKQLSRCTHFAPHAKVVYATARRLEAMAPFPTGNIKVLQMDVSTDESVDRSVKEILNREGRIDIVVSNAGAMCFGSH